MLLDDLLQLQQGGLFRQAGVQGVQGDIYQLPVHTPDKIGIMPRFRAIEAEEEKLNKQ